MTEQSFTPQRPSMEDLLKVVMTYLDDEKFDQVRDLLIPLHPAEIAILMTGLSAFERNLLFDLAPEEEQHEVLSHLEEADQEWLLEQLSDERIADVLLHLDSDDATDIAALLDETTRDRVLQATPREDREEVEQLLTYDEESAGGLMALELVTVFDDQTVREAVEAVRKAHDQGMVDIHYVNIIDRQGKLEGRAAILQIMLASRSTPIIELLDEDMVVITEEMDQEEVAQIFQRYDLISAPVVNGEGALVGRITIDDIVDVIQEEAEEDIGLLTGTGEEEVTERNIFTATRLRLPWLLIAFVGELIGAFVISTFEQSLASVLVIAFFIPVIIAVAGNVGIQSSTIVVRGLATGEIPSGRIFSRVGRETLVSSLNGIVLAGLLVAVVYFWQSSLLVGVAIALSLICVVIVSAMVGSLTPFLLKRLNQDPALAAGPFITMTNDVAGLTIYLLITSAMLA